MQLINRMRHTPAYFPVFANHRGEVLRVGTGQAYATLADVFTYLSTQTWSNSFALNGTVTVAQGSASVTGSGFSDLTANNFLQVGANWWAIKSIESDNAMTLWHGAQAAVSDTSATVNVLNQFTIELYNNITLTTQTIPNGIDLLITGHTADKTITVTGNNTLSTLLANKHRVEISNLTVDISTATAGLIFGGQSGGRSIFYIHDICNTANVSGGVLTAGLYGSAVTINAVCGKEARFNIGADFISISNVGINTNSVSDHFLIAYNVATDGAHPITIDNHKSISNNSGVVSGQSAGFEFNALAANKVVNITNSFLIAFHTSTPGPSNEAAQVLWSSTVGPTVINVTDSVLDCINNTTDIYSRGSTINLTNTTRADGSACRQVTAI